jgi:hypothetical protein
MSADMNSPSNKPDFKKALRNTHFSHAEHLHQSKKTLWLRAIMESFALILLLSAVFYVGFLQGVRYPSTCILPMANGDSLELRKVGP